MASINPYLHFNGNAEEAFNFYRSVFGGEFQTIMRFKDAPAGMTGTEHLSKKIMHVALPIGNGTLLAGSDTPEHMGAVTNGTNFTIALNTETEEETKRLFDGLSAGGQVTMPLEKVFWGSTFGMFTDMFGIGWMVNHNNQ